MATFAKTTFDAAGYLASRPTYPPRIYETIFSYHALGSGKFGNALDVGCGPGFVALNLASRFKNVTALDPSAKMIAQGLQPTSGAKIEYKVGNAESLSDHVEGKVDLVVAGQAAHWFDHKKVWKQLTEIVKPGGTVAYIGYAEPLFPKYPRASTVISKFSSSPKSLGPYWSQPGRNIVEGLLDQIPFPVTPTANKMDFGELIKPIDISQISELSISLHVDTSSWDPSSAIRIKNVDGKQWLMSKNMNFAKIEDYFRTWSSLHSYHEAHPEDAAKRGEEGDIVERFMRDLKSQLKEDGWEGGEVEFGSPLVLMMIKKKP